MRLFDEYVMVDWSASSTPTRGKDSIWIGRWCDGEVQAWNVPTRASAKEQLRELLLRAVDAQRHTIIGFDFPYGYPRGFAHALGRPDLPPWLAVWRLLTEEIEDDGANRSNRFDVAAMLNERVGEGPGPFWGCPADRADGRLHATKAPFPHGGLAEYRRTELALRARPVPARPLATWQLMYAGCVGSQALLGIPVVHALRFDPRLEPLSRVWPFETGFAADAKALVLHAEIWPGVVELVEQPGEVRDETQVKTLATALARSDELGTLAEWFAPAGADEAAAREEGWILGA